MLPPSIWNEKRRKPRAMKRSDQTSARSSGPPKVNKKILLSDEMEVTLKRIQESKNVIGVIVINSEGMPVKSSLDSTLTVQVKAYMILSNSVY